MKTRATALTGGDEIDTGLPEVHNPPSFEVRSAPEARVTSKRTFDTMTQHLEAQMGLEEADLCGLQLECSRTSAGTVASRSSESIVKQTAAAFVEGKNSTVIDVPETTTSYISCTSRLEQSLAELTSSLKQLKKDHENMKKDHENMKKDHENMKKDFDDRLAVLEEDSARYRDVIKRRIVSEVHKYLQRKFGDKEEEQQWDEYLAMVFGQNTSWFRSHGLKLKDLALMEKSDGTPLFQQGNNSAHQPQLVIIKHHIIEALSSEDPAWASWWKLVQGIRRPRSVNEL
ncbi:hypothetical protein Vretifemale_16377 [Volvox reticuliferus]|uniref:Uncharacterized protein n=1 Tax=Volvox reticuliferus TaxID=1737510 RepID=A0A8J4CTF9_9CHLO|nr:hypothetical protein Vretifemale_16377 [Volvox reticuliferus]